MTHIPVVAGIAFIGMSYAVWRAFAPEKRHRPGPHNNWRNQQDSDK